MWGVAGWVPYVGAEEWVPCGVPRDGCRVGCRRAGAVWGVAGRCREGCRGVAAIWGNWKYLNCYAFDLIMAKKWLTGFDVTMAHEHL